MTEEDTNSLKAMLTSEMVSRVTLAEAINIMHNLAVQEVDANVEKMSDEEKTSAFEELTAKVEASKAENEKVKSE
jgi:PIN domain nuclease of toxin-antitoxin system|tara:strand:+ start:202 stop:426 length:225 start_codon:yes stop_codon:yes gene_type:complete